MPSGILNKLSNEVKALFAMLLSMANFARGEWAEPIAEQIPGSGGPIQRAAQVGTIITVVVIGVVALVGILIFAQIDTALPAIDNEDLADSQTSVTDGFAGAMELIPVVLLVLVAALVIGVVQRMRMQ